MNYQQHKFKVFVNENGEFGDAVSLILDESHRLDLQDRIAITAEIGNDETVFINDLATNNVSIYSAQEEVDFAGSVLLGTAWQIAQLKGEPTTQMICKGGAVSVRQEGDIYWLQASIENNIGNWQYEQLTEADAVNEIDVANTKGWKKMLWAWIEEGRGLMRARTFAEAIGMPEVQGNGSGAMNLASQLQRQITILHGDGSMIYARPTSSNTAEVGGRVVAVNQ